jgi:hypothetical protein
VSDGDRLEETKAQIMEPHIARTIEDIELKIGFLQRLAQALRGFDSATAVGAPLGPNLIDRPHEAPVEKNGHAKPRLARSSRTATVLAPPAMRACKPTRKSAETDRIAKAVEKMLEPLTAPLIASKANVDLKRASNFITFSLAKGWLVRAGRGEYKRSKVFGGGIRYWREVVSGDPSRN